MYRLILVDDEEIVLRSIQKVFQLSDYNFEIVGTFTNPMKALEELPSLSPHLIITDIKMPAMDGLKFSVRAKQLLSEAEIVILSGYDDFGFAQAALKLGISDYLLKPVKKQDFSNMLKSMEVKISNKQNVAKQLLALKTITMSNYSTLRNKFFFTLAEGGDLENESMQNLYEQLGLCLKGYPFILVKFAIYEIHVLDDYMSTLEKLMNEFTLYMKDYGFFEEFYTDEYLYFYIYDIDMEALSKGFINKVKEFIAGKKNGGIHLLFGISQIHNKLNDLFFAIAECDEYILTADNTISTAQLSTETIHASMGTLHLPYKEIENLFLGILAYDKHMIQENIQMIFSQPAATLYRDYSYSIAHILLLRLVHMQRKYKAPQNIITSDLLSANQIRQRYSPTQLKDLMEEKSLEICELVHAQSQEAPSKTILSAVAYIEQHFNENISLGDVAKHIHISKNYLCDLFKKELNLTFIDYITNIRVEKAKYYLTQTDMKMYEISTSVGYNDYAYFSQIFKRYTGSTLSNYRKQH